MVGGEREPAGSGSVGDGPVRLALSGFAPDGRRFRTEAVLYAAHFRDPAYAKETVLDEMYFGLWKEVGPWSPRRTCV